MPGEANAADIGLFEQLAPEAPAAHGNGMEGPEPLARWVLPLALLAVDGLGGMLAAWWHAGTAGRQAGAWASLVLFLILAAVALGRRGSYGDGIAALGLRPAAMAVGEALAVTLLAVGMLDAAPGYTVLSPILVLATLAMLAGRAGLCLALSATARHWLAPRAVLVGSGRDVRDLLAACQADPAQPRLLGWIDPEYTPDTVPGLPRLGGQHRLAELARAGVVDQVILAGPIRDDDALARGCAALPVAIRRGRPRLGRPASRQGGWELAHVLEPPAGFWGGLLKRGEDLLLGGLLLALLAIPMVLVALAIRLDSPGPALFRQRRIGLHGQSFAMLKFRTMRHAQAAAEQHGPGCIQAVRGDPRVTRLGAFLRRTSLDELPQLFNVLRGEMALVGPRPHAPGTSANGRPFEAIVPFYEGRHRVKPGITGLAQVRGLRGETRTEADVLARVETDYEYIAGWSVWLDLQILLRTALAVLSMRNAY